MTEDNISSIDSWQDRLHVIDDVKYAAYEWPWKEQKWQSGIFIRKYMVDGVGSFTCPSKDSE